MKSRVIIIDEQGAPRWLVMLLGMIAIVIFPEIATVLPDSMAALRASVRFRRPIIIRDFTSFIC
jgi:hypothetical protein